MIRALTVLVCVALLGACDRQVIYESIDEIKAKNDASLEVRANALCGASIGAVSRLDSDDPVKQAIIDLCEALNAL